MKLIAKAKSSGGKSPGAKSPGRAPAPAVRRLAVGRPPEGFEALNRLHALRPIEDDAALHAASEVANRLAVLEPPMKPSNVDSGREPGRRRFADELRLLPIGRRFNPIEAGRAWPNGRGLGPDDPGNNWKSIGEKLALDRAG